MKCNLCNGTDFLDMNGRKAVRCKKCGSLERTRLLWLYFDRLPINSQSKILHIAPEEGIYQKLKNKVVDGNYITADFDPSRYPFSKECKKIDLTDMETWPSRAFDLIIHVHVLEHIPCNIAYPLYHLHRMLKDGGSHLCIIPFSKGKYDESFQDIGNEERTRRFGQFDHVRQFGSDDIPMHLGKIINVPAKFDATENFSEETLTNANIPPSQWRGFHGGTVLLLKKDDFKLVL